ncbi:hypothetical protein OTK49_02730 [Vibrio coralliirubri]|uniref:hypothetical protein n=1 Tax=Vibrio coralliirubri TaxID=1516159 RepID=UPI0022849DCA|nr:hypothetical protein [Vibrio coralliirubri]MCY9861433.1 hypothetical protein [Vibrio coralliirubri]
MKNTNTLTNTTEASKYTMSKERFAEVVSTFKAFVKDKNNHPTYDKQYGTKYAGKLNIKHYIVYAILRQKDTAKTSHDPIKSGAYLDSIAMFRKWAKEENAINAWYLSGITAPFGITEDELKDALSAYFE